MPNTFFCLPTEDLLNDSSLLFSKGSEEDLKLIYLFVDMTEPSHTHPLLLPFYFYAFNEVICCHLPSCGCSAPFSQVYKDAKESRLNN
jgi:hypothetical protein